MTKTKEEIEQERKALENARRHANLVSRLVANGDFREWLYGVLDQFCAFDQGLDRVDEFHQGIRAAGSFIMQGLRNGDGAGKMLGEFYERQFATPKETTQEDK